MPARGLNWSTRKAFELLQASHKRGLIVVNQCDASDARVVETLQSIQQRFGTHCLPINLPSADYTTMVGDGRRAFRVSHLLKLQGNQSVEVDAAGPGDICAVARVDNIHFDAVLHDSHDEDHFYLQPATFPPLMSALAIEASCHSDEQKLSDVLQRMAVEDPSLVVNGMMVGQRTQRNETVISGLGRVHLQVILDKIHAVYHLNVTTRLPGIPYRETILKAASVHHRHKKQKSGGSGQFDEVFLPIEPLPRGAGFEFASEVVGGAIPSQHLPAVEKGVREVMNCGAIAGYPMQNIRVVVYDGKHHSVDSKGIAFVTAGKKAFLAAISCAEPILLEPYMALQVTAPVWSVGDITGHLSAERGLIGGSELKTDNDVCIEAEVPLATVLEYSTVLRSMTAGEGEFAMTFSRYGQVPASVQQALSVRN